MKMDWTQMSHCVIGWDVATPSALWLIIGHHRQQSSCHLASSSTNTDHTGSEGGEQEESYLQIGFSTIPNASDISI